MSKSINLAQKLALFTEHWSPKVIAELNDYQVKLARLKGEFVWHNHADTDELFLVLEGQMTMHFRDHAIDLKAGELIVVPCGVDHKPSAEDDCSVLLIEPRGVVNTGEVDSNLKAENEVWI